MTRLLTTLAAASLLVALQPADARAYRFGTTPLNDVLYWSGQTTKCSSLTTNELAAMVLAPTWPETGAGSSYTPSPMTMSRWDYASDRLWEGGDHRTAYPRSFFHPGVGMWQLDSAGLGSALPTWRAISSYYAAKLVAQRMASAYCSSSGSESQRRAAAWRPWRACANGACESIYQAIYEPDRIVVTADGSVGREGGMVARTCRYSGDLTTFTCWFVNPAAAQGHKSSWQQAPLNGNYTAGPSPLSYAFYTFGFDPQALEWRHWFEQDTGYAVTSYASRPSGKDVRSYSLWYQGRVLCDQSTGRGYCPPGG